MKQLFITTLIVLAVCIGCYGQKTGKYSYGTVDTLFQYKNAQIIVYAHLGKIKSDTVYYSKMNKDITINQVNVLIADDSKIVVPKPTPMPIDTLPNKKIKNLEKMKPRWDNVKMGGGTLMENTRIYGGGAYDESPSIDSIWRADAVKDTIRVIMLVSDTTLTNGFQSQRCYWLKGYFTVRRYWLLDGESPYDYYNDKKAPISKSLIVWLSKEIK